MRRDVQAGAAETLFWTRRAGLYYAGSGPRLLGCIMDELTDRSPRIPFVVQRVNGPYDYIIQSSPSKIRRSALRASAVFALFSATSFVTIPP